MHDWLIALILGIVEGITEFLPVSSTGHLLIAEKSMAHLGWFTPDHWLAHKSQAKDLFNIVIQCGAVIAVLPLFPQRIYKFVFELGQKETQDYLLKMLTAFVITGAVGFVLVKKGFRLEENPVPIAWALLIGGVAFLAIEWWLCGKKLSDEITWPIVIAVAVGQLIVAVFRGSSGSGSMLFLVVVLA